MYRDITVLLVEDNAQLAGLIDRRLSAKHFKVLRAPDRITATGLVDEADVLIVELHLPNGDGRDILAIWSRQLDVGPAMVITGRSLASTDVREAWTVMYKPFEIDQLVEMIERFARVVRGARCCSRVTILEKRMRIMGFVIAGLGGVELLPKFIQLAGAVGPFLKGVLP